MSQGGGWDGDPDEDGYGQDDPRAALPDRIGRPKKSPSAFRTSRSTCSGSGKPGSPRSSR